MKQLLFNEVEKQLKQGSELNLDVLSCGHGNRPFGSNPDPESWIDYSITINNKKIIECLTFGELKLEIENFYKEFDKKKDKRKYNKTLFCESNSKSLDWSGNHTLLFPTKIIWLNDIPKEFYTLQKHIFRYTINQFLIQPNNFYEVKLFGKRGHYDESGNRVYFMLDPKLCNYYIQWIREHRSSRDILDVSIEKYDYLDDLDYSIEYETECYGTRKVELSIKVLTPARKVKAIL